VSLDGGVGVQRVATRGGLAGWQRKRVLAFIEEHLSETISLATLSAVAQLSPYHFARAFKQSLGMPPHRFHMNRRVERAKVLLPNRTVTEVALAVGYAETSSFSSGFRRATGMSPTEFRRALTERKPPVDKRWLKKLSLLAFSRPRIERGLQRRRLLKA
jgi:AraC family transcriptional regulator